MTIVLNHINRDFLHVVTFGKFNSLPISKSDAEKGGWKLTSACGGKLKGLM